MFANLENQTSKKNIKFFSSEEEMNAFQDSHLSVDTLRPSVKKTSQVVKFERFVSDQLTESSFRPGYLANKTSESNVLSGRSIEIPRFVGTHVNHHEWCGHFIRVPKNTEEERQLIVKETEDPTKKSDAFRCRDCARWKLEDDEFRDIYGPIRIQHHRFVNPRFHVPKDTPNTWDVTVPSKEKFAVVEAKYYTWLYVDSRIPTQDDYRSTVERANNQRHKRSHLPQRLF